MSQPRATDLAAISAVLILATGLALRRHRRLHPPLMVSAFVIDLSLVLYLELTRSAVATAVRTDSRLLGLHVAVAVATLLLYLALLPSGWRILRGSGSTTWHRRLALVFVLCRLATFVTAFWVPHSGGG